MLDDVQARHMGLLTTDEIKAVRTKLGATQKELSELLQIGEKSWTRWETGRDRPSRSMNVLLLALVDGRIDLRWLEGQKKRVADVMVMEASFERGKSARAARIAGQSKIRSA